MSPRGGAAATYSRPIQNGNFRSAAGEGKAWGSRRALSPHLLTGSFLAKPPVSRWTRLGVFVFNVGLKAKRGGSVKAPGGRVDTRSRVLSKVRASRTGSDWAMSSHVGLPAILSFLSLLLAMHRPGCVNGGNPTRIATVFTVWPPCPLIFEFRGVAGGMARPGPLPMQSALRAHGLLKPHVIVFEVGLQSVS